MKENTKVESTKAVADNKTKTTPNIESDVQLTPAPDEPEKKKKAHEAREHLKAQSRAVRELVESGKYKTINDALIDTLYNDETHHEFKSYRGWKIEGYQVRKGEKGFLLWGRPKEKKNDKENQKPDTISNKTKEEHDPFYPVAHVFSEAQVDQKVIEIEPQVNATVSKLANIRYKKQERDLQNEMTR